MYSTTINKHVGQQDRHRDIITGAKRVHQNVSQAGRYIRDQEKQQLIPVYRLIETKSIHTPPFSLCD